jgi:hypothetical protein
METRTQMTLEEMFASFEECDFDNLSKLGKPLQYKKEILEGGVFIYKNQAKKPVIVYVDSKRSTFEKIEMVYYKLSGYKLVKNTNRVYYGTVNNSKDFHKIPEKPFLDYFNQKYFVAGKEKKSIVEKPVVKASQETPQGEFKSAMLDNGTKTLAAIEKQNSILTTAFNKANSISEKMQMQMFELMKDQTKTMKELLKVQEENRALLEKIHDGWFAKPSNEEEK